MEVHTTRSLLIERQWMQNMAACVVGVNRTTMENSVWTLIIIRAKSFNAVEKLQNISGDLHLQRRALCMKIDN